MSLLQDIQDYSSCISRYSQNKIIFCGQLFESQKKNLTKKIIKRRGQFSRPTVHVGMAGIIAGVLLSNGLVGSSSKTARNYPEADAATPQQIPQEELTSYKGDSFDSANMETVVSEKVRDSIIEHEVKPGETISQIASNYDIDTNTIRWANDLSDADAIKPGQKLKILPVSGVAHQVVRADTVYSIAKKYDTNPQSIVDFPFNDIGENLTLQIGQILIVPDGAPPEKPHATKAPAPVVSGPTTDAKPGTKEPTPPSQGTGKSIGKFIWPVRGLITQGFSKFHTAVDIAGSQGDAVVAADGGEVIVSGWTDNTGYGNRIMIKHPNGYVTLYGHLLVGCNKVKVGDKVSQGQQIGCRGNTGRSTGPHTHFEIRKPGSSNLNPLSFLK
jgi:murein DD-endopeptidase MepM/ murein hydrolase activator NlpD